MKTSGGRLIKNATAGVRAGKWLLRAADVSLSATLLVVGLVTIVAVVSVAKAKYSELPVSEDPFCWVLGGSAGVAMAAMSVAVVMRVNAPHYRTTGKIALGAAVGALAAVIAVGDVDPEMVFHLMEALL
uniref:Uncharacterized protein n=1 Tax=Arundo donax TaxID=35708 RepID=A0A0A9UA18_ARUDO